MSGCNGCGAALAPSVGRGRPRKWCSERCRKRSYDLACVVCGGRVDGTTPGKIPDIEKPVCIVCAPRFYALWDRERVIAAIQRWADEHGGVPPTATDWDSPFARARGLHEKADKFEADDCWPWVNTVRRYFGSWNAAIAAAGFEPWPPGHHGRPGEDPEVVAETVRLYRSGLTGAQVGERMGVHAKTVYARLSKVDEPRRARFTSRA